MKTNKLSLAISALTLLFSSALLASPVNINTASASQIASALSGIGMIKAKAIIAYRKNNGAFKKASDLINVKGIGKATLKSNKGDVLLK